MAPGDRVEPDPAAVGPYNVSPADVCALVPEFTPTEPGGLAAPGQGRVGNAQIADWITQVSAAVAAKLWRAGQIADLAQLDPVRTAARTLVAVGAAAYLEEAAHPERASVSDTTYGQVLWTRYQTGLADLAATVDGILEAQEADAATGAGGLAAGRFPRPRFSDCMEF